ncbi:RluA family pseudouridine synthase [Hyphococcus flavus]|uniref:Pseudouridine synthase n=1 Tax=Hyphococcus flavus TaxID=1866326 RepID=A0AAE9ZKX8_9PROT|nr:RluA family pseudouridine synthase [Hyphococcus flavus]WDI32520.1 RluA family pseudouridine synthase [Hyphococcus flavus]
MTAEDETLKPDEKGAYSFTPGAEDIGARIDKWLSDRIEALTRSRLKALIEEGALSRDGDVFTDPSWKLREGENYTLTPPPVADPEPLGEAISLDVVYEDADLIVINKPAGMVVHPASGNWTGTLVNALIHHCGESLSGVGGVARPGIVHRIDKDTSGLLVVAKNDVAHQGLGAAFSAHDIDRVYEAVAVGAPRPGFGTIDAALARATGDRKKMAVVNEQAHNDLDASPSRRGARHAITHYKVLEAFGRTRAKLKGDALACLLECRLETGRTHQIRVHLSSIGHPLIGDQTYGRGPGLGGLKPGDEAADKSLAILNKFRRQALHAKVLGFAHPITGEALRFKRDAPADFQTLLAALRDL